MSFATWGNGALHVDPPAHFHKGLKTAWIRSISKDMLMQLRVVLDTCTTGKSRAIPTMWCRSTM